MAEDRIVVIVASAGGVSALCELAKDLPRDFRGSILVMLRLASIAPLLVAHSPELPRPVLGFAADLTCSECGGALHGMPDGRVLRFRCVLGHDYSAKMLCCPIWRYSSRRRRAGIASPRIRPGGSPHWHPSSSNRRPRDMTISAPSPKPAISLAEKVDFLRSPAAYAEAPAKVEARETHMSWVFLTDVFAWKLKKPVRHSFLDYRALASRQRFCEEEFRLNQRLAPEVYLGVVPLVRRSDGALRIGGEGEVVDWLVRMRRLPAAQMLDVALERRTATTATVAAVADHLAAFYVAAPPVPVPEDAYLARFARELALNHAVLHDGAYGLPHGMPAAVLDTLDAILAGERDMLLTPVRAGRVVEGHGDLRPEHLFLGEPPAVIDCLEFDQALRLLDPFEELAFLAMECALLDGTWAGSLVLERCAAALGGRPSERLLAFYISFRACIRGRLSIAHLQEPVPRELAKWRLRTLRYLAQAEAACASLRRPPAAP